MEQGAPIKMVVPSPGIGTPFYGTVLNWGKRPNAALVFMDYIMSRRGQTVWAGLGEAASPLAGIPGALDATSIAPFDATKYNADAVKRAAEEFLKLFRRQ